MFDSNTIEKTLKADYASAVRSRGYFYYVDNRVSNLSINEESGTIEATVEGTSSSTYYVEFNFDFDKNIWRGKCDCPYKDNCKHEVAVLHEVSDRFLTNPKAIERRRRTTPAPQSVKARGVRKIKSVRGKKKAGQAADTPSKSTAKNTPAVLEGGNTAGTYRKLPLVNGSFQTTLDRHRTNKHAEKLQWNETFEGTLSDENVLTLKTISKYQAYNFKEQSIALQPIKGEWYVKCLSCNKKTPTLCTHQMALLNEANRYLAGFGLLNGSTTWQSLVKKEAKRTGVDSRVFGNYFKVVFNNKGFFSHAINENIVSPKWVNTTIDVLNHDRELRKTSNKTHTELLEEGRELKFAYCWAQNNANKNIVGLHFMRGPGFKTKPGIYKTKRIVSHLPNILPTDHQRLAEELFFACNQKDRNTRFRKIKQLLLSNIEQLNSLYQYIYNGSIHGGTLRESNLSLVHFHPSPLHGKFSVVKKDGLVRLRRHLTLDGNPFDYSEVTYANEVFCATYSTAYCFENEQMQEVMKLFSGHDEIIIPHASQNDLTRLVTDLRQYFDVETVSDIIMEEEVLTDPQFQILLREVGEFILFEPRLKYDDYSFNVFDRDSYYIGKKLFRADEADQEFLANFIKNAHPQFDNDTQLQEYVWLKGADLINNYWFLHFNEACQMAGIEVLGQKNLSKFNYNSNKAVTFSHVRSGIDWFEVELGVSFGDEKVKTADWIKALRNKESFVRLKDGTLGILPEEWLKQARQILAIAEVKKERIAISKYRFNIIEDLFEDIDDKKILKELREKKQRIQQIELNKKYKVPKIVNATLRDYQKHGFEWLKFLDESSFGGILADDMGLGKTVQVICLLADQIDKAPSLVVVPRSLLFNWAAELDKFCPKLKYVIHHGPGRAKMIEELLPCHIVITTYGTAVSDVEMFKEFKFNYIILDESQAIKNPNSKRYKAMRILQSNNKIAMTGTPIENNTLDLYAQLSFTSPGLLGTKTGFISDFAKPIDNYGDVEKAALLRKLIHPFLLRRTKEQVAKDLPEKTETIIYCEMGRTQRRLYDNLKQKIKEDIEEVVEEKGLAKSKFQILDGLLRLRQMCNSPVLLNPAFSGAKADSVKIDILLQNLTEELDHHNALIFSQFVSLLSIVRKELDNRGIKYAYLDGSTTKRQKEVDKFMDRDDINIFLISLKAGNTGMNLTKADYVYILDPWWNPAVESQAIDRTHRIGQDKHVFAYKLICKDSIEEKILKLQERKKNLASDIIRTDENVLKSLKKEELMALFD